MTNHARGLTVTITRWALVMLLASAVATPAAAQGNSTPPPPAQEDDPDLDVNFAQPDFSLAALPTTLRVPRHKSAFRVTHRFGRPLGAGDFGDLVGDLFGLDSGALIGLEHRYGLFRRTQVGFYRTSNKTIEFFTQREVLAQGDRFPLTVSALASIEGTNNFRDSYSPALGAVVSREIGDWAAFYVEPIWVNNTNPLPEQVVDDNNTFIVGLGTRIRIRPTVYLVLEGAPRTGFTDEPNVAHASFGLEKRAGGHIFQLTFSNSFGTTLAQVARGGTSHDDWYLGFHISRKFF